jgi:Fe-Mn family superoxide dismutase
MNPTGLHAPGGKGGEPDGALAEAINRDFGSFAALKSDFNKAGAGQFGSGWAMVQVDEAGKLVLAAKPNQDSPLMEGPCCSAMMYGSMPIT